MLSQANSLGLLSSTSSDTLRRRSKREEQARQAQALSCQRQIVLRKEQELAELREALAAQEGELSTLVKQVGARSQRVDVATLCGTPSIKQVGCEMAAAIRRRQERRKQALREKLHKMQSKLDHDIAHNRTLRQEIEERRHARLHHMAAVNIGGKQVENSTKEISEMIVAAQRAYAERKTCMVRLEELKRELKTDAAQWEALMESCDAEMDALDEECAQREKELDDLERETAAMLAVSRREEEAQQKQLEHYASVRNRRLEHEHGLEQVFATLRVHSVIELIDAYTMTASKILSSWQKHGEQEGEIERLEEERKALQREYELYATVAPEATQPWLAVADSALDAEKLEVYEKQEKGLSNLCEEVGHQLQQMPLLSTHHGLSQLAVNPHNLLALLGLMESAAVRVARRYRALVNEAQEGSDEADDQARSVDGAQEAAHVGSKKRAVENQVTPPSMEGFITHHHKTGDASEQVVGLGEQKYGRKSLRGELMSQILDGVQTQMEKMHEEEILVKIGEKMREASAAPNIDKVFRDSTIDHWLHKRRQPAHEPSSRGPASARSLPATRRSKFLSSSVSAGSIGLGLRGGLSNTSGRDVLESVGRINADRANSQASVATCLPRGGRLSAMDGGAHRRGCGCSHSAASLPLTGHQRDAGARAGTDDINALSHRVTQLKRERVQIQELKQIATAASSRAMPALPLGAGSRSMMSSSSVPLLNALPE